MKIKTISDERIIGLMNEGRLIVKFTNRRNPVVIKDGKQLSPYLVKGSRCSDCERFAYKLCLEGKNRSIVRSKLVWFYRTRKLIVPGHELHHIDEDRLNDRFKNLEPLTEKAHRDYHNGNGEVPF